jgi:magnesium transporter
MANPLLLPEIRSMIAAGDDQGLAEIMNELHPATVAEFAEGLSVEETWELLAHADVGQQAEVFPFFSAEKEVELVEGIGRERMSKLLEAMSHDDRVDLLQRCDETTVDSLLPLIAKADREDIRRLLSYPEGSAGSLMTTDYAMLPPDTTVEEAINLLRRQASQKETIYYIYVVDAERHLIGFVSLRDLILARPSALIRDIMTTDVVTVRAEQDQEEVARQLAKYDFLAMPVVDDQNRIIGIVTHDDVLDVLEDEASEDLARTGAAEPLGRPYFAVSVLQLLRSRVIWLLLLAFAATLTVNVLSYFEEVLNQIVSLSLFIPLLIGVGGNAGAQSATTIVRAMAIDDVRSTDLMRVTFREARVGFLLGTTLAVLALGVVWLFFGRDLAVIVSLSLVAICTLASLVGSLMPILADRVGVDPAVVSAPFVTTVVDASGLVVYFLIARAIFNI